MWLFFYVQVLSLCFVILCGIKKKLNLKIELLQFQRMFFTTHHNILKQPLVVKMHSKQN